MPQWIMKLELTTDKLVYFDELLYHLEEMNERSHTTTRNVAIYPLNE